MARQLKFAGPAGQGSLFLSLYEEGNPVAVELLLLTENPADTGIYLSADVTSSAGRYDMTVMNISSVVIATYLNVPVGSTDPKIYAIGDMTHDPNIQVLGDTYRHTNVGTGTGFDEVTITEGT